MEPRIVDGMLECPECLTFILERNDRYADGSVKAVPDSEGTPGWVNIYFTCENGHDFWLNIMHEDGTETLAVMNPH